MTRWRSPWLWSLAAASLVLTLTFWCQLHASAMGVAPIGLAVSLPWGLKSAVGWILAGGLLAVFGERILGSRLGRCHGWSTRISMAAAVPFITLGNEVLLLSGDSPLGLWVYERLPAHLPFAALLFGGYLWIRARQPSPSGAGATSGTLPVLEPCSTEPPTATVEVMTGTGRTVVALDDIECLEADRNYINVHTPQRSYLLRQTLTSLEKTLRPDTFLRVHRSTIVNRCKIRERRSGGVLVLSSGRTVRVSRAFADRVS